MLRFALAAIALSALTARSANAADYVKIGSWNIENLGRPPLPGRPGQAPAAIVEHVRLSGVDVLALQEIYDTDDVPETRTNGKLDAVLRGLNDGAGQDWDYVLFTERTDTDARGQLTGVLWNKARVTKLGEAAVPVEFATPQTWKRLPWAVQFSAGAGKTDFVLIPVHMKSNVPADDPAALAPTAEREAEARTLAAHLDDVRTRFADQDIVILGDTNAKSGDEPAMRAFADAGFRDLNAGDVSSYRYVDRLTKLPVPSPFDRFFVPADQPEFKWSREYVLTPADPDDHDRRLSDHAMVLTTVRILPDDDGPK